MSANLADVVVSANFAPRKRVSPKTHIQVNLIIFYSNLWQETAHLQ